MQIPTLYSMRDVMSASGYTEEQVLQWGYVGEIIFLTLVPEVGACAVPAVALSHFMAGVDEYPADAMPEVYSGQPSGPWTIKRDRLHILAESWEAFSKTWRQQEAIIRAADAKAIADKAVADGHLTLDVLAFEISKELVLRERGDQFADDDMGLTVQATRYKIGGVDPRTPGVRSRMLQLIHSGQINPLAVTNNQPAVHAADVAADNFPEWHLSPADVEKVRARLLADPLAQAVALAAAEPLKQLAASGIAQHSDADRLDSTDEQLPTGTAQKPRTQKAHTNHETGPNASPSRQKNHSPKTKEFVASVHSKLDESLRALRAKKGGADPTVEELITTTLAQFDPLKYRGPMPARGKVTRHLVELHHKSFVWPHVVLPGKGTAAPVVEWQKNWKTPKMVAPRG